MATIVPCLKAPEDSARTEERRSTTKGVRVLRSRRYLGVPKMLAFDGAWPEVIGLKELKLRAEGGI
jgi:hypothetical protein